MKLKIKKVRPTAIIPQFKTDGAVAMDFHVSLDGMKPGTKGLGDREFVLLPGEIAPVPLGVAIQLEPGYEMRIRSRSSIMLQGLEVYIYENDDKSGTIDSDYRGEVHAILINRSTRAFVLTDGMRVCQGIISRVECLANGLEMEIVDELDPTERGDGKFGHTNQKGE